MASNLLIAVLTSDKGTGNCVIVGTHVLKTYANQMSICLSIKLSNYQSYAA